MKPQVHLTSGAFAATMERTDAAHLLRKLRRDRARLIRYPFMGCIYIPGFTLHTR